MTPIGDVPAPGQMVDDADAPLPWESIEIAEEDREQEVRGQGSEVREEGASSRAAPARGGAWTIPLLCAGIGLIACCLIIPQTDVNRRMAYQKKSLEQDLASIQNQAQVNDEFLKRVSDDPGLAERLAQRQMNIVREGSQVWRDPEVETATTMSPFELVNVPRPAPLPAYQPVGGWFAGVCRDPHSNLYLTGAALMMLAAGLVMGEVPVFEMA